MGRLTKAKIDEIEKLMKAGFTQKETAEKVGVHVRTVRKYDPQRQKKTPGPRSMEDRLATIEEAIKACWDWIDFLYWAMMKPSMSRKASEKETYRCSRCDGKLEYDEQKGNYVCRSCGHQLFWSFNWCYHCLSQTETDYVKEIDEWVCRRCGAKRYGPPVSDTQRGDNR